MVIAHSGKVGQWSKQNAIDEQTRSIAFILISVAVLSAGAGFLLGLTFHGGIVAGASIVTMLALWLSWKKLSKLMDASLETRAKRRLGMLQGGEAEAWVSMLLRKGLGEKWHLFDNLMIAPNRDIDHVLVGPAGLFIISTKSNRGHFKLDHRAAKPVFNGGPTRWPQDAINQALDLRNLLPLLADDPHAKPPWVQAVLALPFAHIETPDLDPDTRAPRCGQCWVLHEKWLIEALDPETTPKHRKLGKAEVERWVAALEVLQGKYGNNTSP